MAMHTFISLQGPRDGLLEINSWVMVHCGDFDEHDYFQFAYSQNYHSNFRSEKHCPSS